MGIFNVTDKFAADQFRISLNFSDEGWHNVSVVAKNFFFTDNETLLDEVFTYHLTFEIVGKVKMTGETPEVRSDKRKPRQIIGIIAFG